MTKNLQTPKNWQDFEILCKKLWGEIWNIPYDIKQNGRQGQEQYGVDVYGVPLNKDKYFGIQCKGKDDYLGSKLTTKEIDQEIEKAKNFKPCLEKLIFATTAVKDSRLEEYVRVRDIENRKSGSFGISLYCWGDISDLIEDFPKIKSWYLNGLSMKGKYDFNVFFSEIDQDGFKDKIILQPSLIRETTKFKINNSNSIKKLTPLLNNLSFLQANLYKDQDVNYSYVSFQIILKNEGDFVIEDWMFNITFTKGVNYVYEDMFEQFISDISVNNSKKSIKYNNKNNSVIVQNRNVFFETSILVEVDAVEIEMEWEINARDFSKKGTSNLIVNPIYLDEIRYEEVDEYNDDLEDKITIKYKIEKSED